MTRKHFVAIAKVLRGLRPDGDPNDDRGFFRADCVQWEATVKGMAELASRYNYRFDEKKFIDACGGLF